MLSVNDLHEDLVKEGIIGGDIHISNTFLGQSITTQRKQEIYLTLKIRVDTVNLEGAYGKGLICLLIFCFKIHTLHQNILLYI